MGEQYCNIISGQKLFIFCLWGYRHYTTCHKTFHFIFHYNSRISWWIFTLYAPMETGTNTIQNSYKIYNFNLAVFSTAAMVYSVRDDRSRRLPAVRYRTGCVQPLQKVVQSLSCQILLGHFLISLRTENLLDSRRFSSKNFIFRAQHIPIFHFSALLLYTKTRKPMKWTLQTLHAEYSFLFPLIQKVYKSMKLYWNLKCHVGVVLIKPR